MRFAKVACLLSLVALSASAGTGQKKAFILGGTLHFEREINPLAKVLPTRGWSTRKMLDVKDSAEKDAVIKVLKEEAQALMRGDQMLISLQCHGETLHPNPDSDHSGDDHVCCMNSDCSQFLFSSTIKEVAKIASSKGAQIVVMDESCGGGTTVKMLEGIPNTCAMATTTGLMPALTGAPSFSKYLESKDIKNFEDLGRHGSYEIFKNLAARPYQRIYTSGCFGGEVMKLRDAYMMMIGSSGHLAYSDTPLAKYLFPDVANLKVRRQVNDAIKTSCEYHENLDIQLTQKLNEVSTTLDESWWQSQFQAVAGPILGQYIAWGIDFDLSKDLSFKSLTDALKERVAFLQDLARREMVAIASLNAEVEILESQGATYGRQRRIAELAQEVRELQTKVVNERPKISAMLNLLEETMCAREITPCSEIEI